MRTTKRELKEKVFTCVMHCHLHNSYAINSAPCHDDDDDDNDGGGLVSLKDSF